MSLAEMRHFRHCTGGVGSVVLCLSGRTRSSGARGAADHWPRVGYPIPAVAAAAGIDSIGLMVTSIRLVRTSWAKGHAKPLRPARLFFWSRNTKPPSGMLGGWSYN